MSAALLSRFDLVFILLDKPDEVLDKRVSDHIISVSYPVWHTVVLSFALKTCYGIQGESVPYH